MLAESHPLLRRVLRFFLLPYCYVRLVNWKECSASKLQVVSDLLYIFFKLKYYPDNYSPCRFWELDRKAWSYYYGSSYDPYQRIKLRKEVQRSEYLIVFDDKEVCDLLCRGISDVSMPAFYGSISSGMDYRAKVRDVFASIAGDKFIIKPTAGSAGQGIALIFSQGDEVKVKVGSEVMDLDAYELDGNSIIQELIVQDDAISAIASSSVNTIRVVTFFTKTGEAILISASMRFGVGDSHIDNWSAGGIAVGVDHITGILKKVAYDKKGNQYMQHPISDFTFEGFQVPHWEDIVNMAIKIQEACPFLKLLGLDIAITSSGPMLIEVNPSTDLVFQEQTAGPFLEDKRTRKEFEKYDLFINKYQKNLK